MRARPFLDAKLTDQDRISTRLLKYLLDRQEDTDLLDIYLLRVGQLFGAHTNIFRTIDLMPRNTVRDYENIVKRLNAVPAYVDQNIAVFTDAISRGLMQPGLVTDRVIAQLRAQAVAEPSKTDLLAAFRQWPSGIASSDRERLTKEAHTAYKDSFLPAWRKLTEFMEKTYAPKARTNIALTSIPDGKRFYSAQVRSMTTTSLTPEQIHELGKQGVKRLEAEMLAVAREASIAGSLSEYERKLIDSPEQHFRSKEEMLAYAGMQQRSSNPNYRESFKHIPRLLYGIRAIPPATEAPRRVMRKVRRPTDRGPAGST